MYGKRFNGECLHKTTKVYKGVIREKIVTFIIKSDGCIIFVNFLQTGKQLENIRCIWWIPAPIWDCLSPVCQGLPKHRTWPCSCFPLVVLVFFFPYRPAVRVQHSLRFLSGGLGPVLVLLPPWLWLAGPASWTPVFRDLALPWPGCSWDRKSVV